MGFSAKSPGANGLIFEHAKKILQQQNETVRGYFTTDFKGLSFCNTNERTHVVVQKH